MRGQCLVLTPSEMDVAVSPVLAILTALDVTLSMASTSMTCEHPNLDELDFCLSEKLAPDVSIILARVIIDKADSLCQDIARYKTLVLNDLSMNAPMPPHRGIMESDFPF